MSENLDKSLDSIIDETKKGGRGRGRGGRGRGRGGRGRGGRSSFSSFNEPSNPLAREQEGDDAGPERRERFNRSRSRGGPYSREDNHVQGDSESDWKHDMYRGAGGDSAARSGTPGVARVDPVSKILVSGLDADVSGDDVKEIFASIGGMSKAVVHYDQNGKSLGTAEVTFNTTVAATKAVKEFDGAEVDGKPMFIKVVGSVVPAPRVVTKRPQNRDFGGARTGKSAMFGSAMNDYDDDDYRPARRGGRGRGRGGAGRGSRGSSGSRGGGRGRGRGGKGEGGGKKEKSSTSGADLDAELDAYQKQRGGSAGGDAGQPAA